MESRTSRATAPGGAAGTAGRGGVARRVGGGAARAARRVRGRWAGVGRDAGMATAEYAVVLIAAVGFAGLLVVILTSAEIREALTALVRGALSV